MTMEEALANQVCFLWTESCSTTSKRLSITSVEGGWKRIADIPGITSSFKAENFWNAQQLNYPGIMFTIAAAVQLTGFIALDSAVAERCAGRPVAAKAAFRLHRFARGSPR